MLLVVGSLTALVAASFGYLSLTSDGSGGAGAQTPDAPAVRSSRDAATPSPLERRLIQEGDRSRAEEALRQGGAAVPTIIPVATEDAAPKPANRDVVVAAAPAASTAADDQRARQEEQARRERVQRKQAFMQAMVAKEVELPGAQLVIVRQPTQKAEQSAPISSETAARPPGTTEAGRAGAGFRLPPPHSIVYGYLTGLVVSTDTGAPVRVRLVEEPYSGLTAIGSFVQRDDVLCLEFTELSDGGPRPVKFKAVALDPETERVCVADDVDHHYLERGILLFGSAFIEGLGEIYRTANTTTTTSLFGTTTTRGEVSPEDAALAAAGKVGERVGQSMGRAAAERPPTVTLDQGRPVGILVLE